MTVNSNGNSARDPNLSRHECLADISSIPAEEKYLCRIVVFEAQSIELPIGPRERYVANIPMYTYVQKRSSFDHLQRHAVNAMLKENSRTAGLRTSYVQTVDASHTQQGCSKTMNPKAAPRTANNESIKNE